MKKIIILTLILFAHNVCLAKAEQGEEITSKKFNESMSHIGEIKTSLLTETQFQALNGTCWVQMTGQDITGSDLSTLKNITNLPDASGRFLRTTGGDAPALMQAQDDQNKEHNHTISFVRFNLASGIDGGGSGLGAVAWGNTKGTVVANYPLNRFGPSDFLGAIYEQGADEARPKNLGVSRFIKINKECP